MALDVGTLVARLQMDRRDFNRGADESESRFSRLGSALGATAKRVGTAGIGVIAAAGAVGLSTAARMEQAEIAFTTMLGSGQKAQAFLSDLSAFAAKTPFEFPELQTAASSLVSAGIEADKVIPIMSTLGDVTSGMGTGSEGIKRATVALQQMNAAGRITGEDLNQLRDAGIPVYDLLAAATGNTKAEIVKMAQAGKLGKTELDAMMMALESGQGLEKFSGLMAKQSTSLTGMVSTLKDTLSVGLADAIEPLLPLIKQGLGGAITFASEQMPRLQTGIEGVVAGLKGDGPISGFTGKLNTLGLGLRALVLAYKDGDVTSDGFVGQMERVGVSLSGAVTWLGQARGSIAGLFPKDAGGGVDFAGLLERTEEGARKLWPQVKSAASSVGELEPVLSVTGAAFGFVAEHIDTFIKYLPLLISGFVAYKAAQALGNVVALASLPIAAGQVLANFALAGAIRSTGSAASGAALQQVAAGQATQGSMIKTGLIAMASGLKMAAAWVIGLGPVALIIAGIAAFIAILVLAYRNSETFRNIVDGAMRGVAGAASYMWESVLKPAFGFVVGVMKTAWENAQTLARLGGEAFGLLAGAAGGMRDALIGAVAFMVEKVLGFFGGLLNGASRVLRALGMDGLADKLDAAGTQVQGFATATNATLNSIKDKTVTVSFKVTGTDLLRDAAQARNRVPSNINVPRGDGPGRGGKALGRVSAAIAGSGAYVTSTYRTPARNRAIGGSPTSYHLDASNPAVDIGGSTSVLNSVAAKLRGMGGWRELLWQVPGHYDHIHAADRGGVFQGPGYVWMGAGQETFASGLGATKIADLPSKQSALVAPTMSLLEAERVERLMRKMDEMVRAQHRVADAFDRNQGQQRSDMAMAGVL